MSGKVTIRVSRWSDMIGIERVVIGAKQPRIANKLRKHTFRSSILLGIALMRRLNYFIDFLGAKAMGQEYHEYTIVAEFNGCIVGACNVNTAMGRDPLVWFLGPIAVERSHRGEGIGTLLINESFKYIKSHKGKKVVLSVANDNVSALALYRKCGFRVAGETGDIPMEREL